MEAANLLQAIFALILVIALFGLCSLLYKKYVIDRNLMKGGKIRRLAIEEQIYLDSKRRLVLVRKDNTEFLLLLGADSETVVNTEFNYNDAAVPKSTPVKKRLNLKNTYSRKKS